MRPLLLLCLACLASVAAELFPTVVFTFDDPGPNELSREPNTDIPTIFQYKITDAALKPGPTWFSDDDRDKSRWPWFDDTQVLAKLPSKQARVNCHAYISQGTIPIKRTTGGAVTNVRLEPVPAQQTWNGNSLKTDSPGLPLNRVNSCCNPSQCPTVCLQSDRALQWNLEILAPQWGFDQSRVLLASRSTFGGSYETYGSKGDAGVWPVYRVPCDFCPVKSCNTTCTNGEFATDYAVYSAVRDPLCFGWGLACRESRLLVWQDGLQRNKVECRPCAPGTWNTCAAESMLDCKW
jgi:hypothetical protein